MPAQPKSAYKPFPSRVWDHPWAHWTLPSYTYPHTKNAGGISNLVRENELLFIVTSPDLESHKCKRVTDFLKNNFILERRRICCISNVNGIMALMKKRCSYCCVCWVKIFMCALSSKSGKLANQLLLPAAKKGYKKRALIESRILSKQN